MNQTAENPVSNFLALHLLRLQAATDRPWTWIFYGKKRLVIKNMPFLLKVSSESSKILRISRQYMGRSFFSQAKTSMLLL